MTTAIRYPFTDEQARAAFDEWGCNCGPTALAFALQRPLEHVRYAIPSFDQRRYTSPTMMVEAINFLQHRTKAICGPFRNDRFQVGIDSMFAGPMTLVRVQWTGPWTCDGAPFKWAARQTHWIATWSERGVPLVFDCNCGIQGFSKWESEIVPAIVQTIPRADGGWYPANIWRLENLAP